MVLFPGKVRVQNHSIPAGHLAGDWVVAEVVKRDGLVVVVRLECRNDTGGWEAAA